MSTLEILLKVLNTRQKALFSTLNDFILMFFNKYMLILTINRNLLNIVVFFYASIIFYYKKALWLIVVGTVFLSDGS